MRLNRSGRLPILISVLVVISLFAAIPVPRVTAAANRSWVWTHWDVDIDQINTRSNSFHVMESHHILVTQGSFGGGDRSISRDRLTDIRNIKVTDGETSLRYVAANSVESCPTTTGIFCLFTINGNELDIYYNFAQRAYSGNRVNIRIEYDIIGALRSYKDGDQLWWAPLATDRDFPVSASRVTVHLPDNLPMIKAAVLPGNWPITQSGAILTFESPKGIDTTIGPEVRVQYQHDPAMAAPPWQSHFDMQVADAGFWERNESWILISWVILTGLIAIGR